MYSFLQDTVKMGSNGLNLFERSDKRTFTSYKDSVNEDGNQFAIFNFHISSVGITLGTVVIIIVVIAIVRNVKMSCLRSAFRRACNCKDYGPRPDTYGQSNNPIIIPHVSRVPIVSSNRSSQLYPDLEPYSFRHMSEVNQGMPGQYNINDMPSAPVGKAAEETPTVNTDNLERTSMQDSLSRKKTFKELQMEQIAKMQQSKM